MQRYEEFLECANYLQHFNKNSSTAVPLRNERYEEYLECANLFAIFNKKRTVRRALSSYSCITRAVCAMVTR